MTQIAFDKLIDKISNFFVSIFGWIIVSIVFAVIYFVVGGAIFVLTYFPTLIFINPSYIYFITSSAVFALLPTMIFTMTIVARACMMKGIRFRDCWIIFSKEIKINRYIAYNTLEKWLQENCIGLFVLNRNTDYIYFLKSSDAMLYKLSEETIGIDE